MGIYSPAGHATFRTTTKFSRYDGINDFTTSTRNITTRNTTTDWGATDCCSEA
jgi:hypothetical protein